MSAAARALQRLYRPGVQRRVFLPEWWMAVVETPRVGRDALPPNAVKFQCDMRMSKHDVTEYLTKIYKLDVRDVRLEVCTGEIEWAAKTDPVYKKALWKEEDAKYAYVYFAKDTQFQFPQLFDQKDEEDRQLENYEKQKSAQDANEQVVNKNRGDVGKWYG